MWCERHLFFLVAASIPSWLKQRQPLISLLLEMTERTGRAGRTDRTEQMDRAERTDRPERTGRTRPQAGAAACTHFASVAGAASGLCFARGNGNAPLVFISATDGRTGTTMQNSESRGHRPVPDGAFLFCPNRNLSFP